MWWSFVLALGGAAGVFMTRRGMWQGFATSTAMQFLWFAYALATRQWGFLFSVFLYAPISVWGWYSWRRHGPPPTGPACTCPCSCGSRTPKAPAG